MPVDLFDHPSGSTSPSLPRALDVLRRDINSALIGRVVGVVLSAVAGLGLVMTPSATQAATMTVTTLVDGTGPCDAHCTLREAVSAAGQNGVVNFAPGLAGTITLNSAIQMLSSVAINGPGASVITLDGNTDPGDAQGETRIFFIAGTAAAVTITGLTLQNGFSAQNGGAIQALGADTHLTLDRVVLRNSHAELDGGGVYSVGKLTLIDCTFNNNTAAGDGGGIYAGDGGGLFTLNLEATRISISSNTAAGGGGAYLAGNASLTSSTISGNAASYGGGFYLHGVATVTHSTISDNSTSGAGGGFYGYEADVTLTNSTVSDNATQGRGGGIGMFGDAVLINSTISNNSAEEGGGVHLVGDAVTTNNGFLNLRNSVVANNAAASPGQWDEFRANGAAASYSLIYGGSQPSFTNGTFGNLIFVDPMLGPLQDNGGPTLPRALSSGSPAIDVGQNSTCAATDQRGVARPVDGDGNGSKICDMGAVERVIDPVFSNGFEST